MLTALNRHLVQPLAARKAGSQHLRYLKYLERTQFDAPEVIRLRQLARLKQTLRHAYETVPFYRRAWDEAGVHPTDVRSLDDLRSFPVLTKADIRAHEFDLLSTAFDVRTLLVKRTSGSTGVPLTVRIDEAGKQWKYACTLRSDEWSGWRRGERVAKVWGNPEYLHAGWRGKLRNRFLDRAVHLDTLRLNADKIAAFVSSLRRHRPGLLFGHAHSLYLVADQLLQAGATDIRPHGIISTAMPLHSWQRRTIERVFGVAVTDRYGCEEVSLIASECEVHQGLHINADSVHVEVEGGGSSGNILVTDLTNHAMPLIRYRTGDVVELAHGDCPCGRGLPRLAKVMGRDADYVVTPSGDLISGISLTENFAMHIPGAAQVQIIQETLALIRIRLVPGAEFSPQSRHAVAKLVRDTFGDGVRHELELVDAIPQEASGKYRFCVSKVAPHYARALVA